MFSKMGSDMALVLWCSSKSTPRIEKQNHILLSCLSTNLLQYHRRDGQRRCQPGQPGAGSRRRGGRGRRIPLAPTRSDLGRAGAKSRARCHRRTRELRRRGPGGGGVGSGCRKGAAAARQRHGLGRRRRRRHGRRPLSPTPPFPLWGKIWSVWGPLKIWPTPSVLK